MRADRSDSQSNASSLQREALDTPRGGTHGSAEKKLHAAPNDRTPPLGDDIVFFLLFSLLDRFINCSASKKKIGERNFFFFAHPDVGGGVNQRPMEIRNPPPASGKRFVSSRTVYMSTMRVLTTICSRDCASSSNVTTVFISSLLPK